MSKRYVIQVNDPTFPGGENWQNVQHPAGGDWLTRSRSTAIADAARLINEGETRELRIGVSRPVYAVTPDESLNYAALQDAAAALNVSWSADEDEDEDEDEDDDAEFELVDEPLDVVALENDGPAYTHGDDPTGN